MAFLDIEKVLSKGVSRAVEQAIKNKLLDVVMPKKPKTTTSRKRAAEDDYLGEPVPQQRKRVYEEQYQAPRVSVKPTTQKNDAPSSKNVKICPSCGTLCAKKMKFCSECGAQLPEETLYQQNAANRSNSACPVCGKITAPDAKFCPECGTDLRRTAGTANKAKKAASAAWPAAYALFPAWTAGGEAACEEDSDGLHVSIAPSGYSAFEAYRILALDAGFRSGISEGTGEYLWKVINDRKYTICGGYDEKTGSVQMLFSIAE